MLRNYSVVPMIRFRVPSTYIFDLSLLELLCQDLVLYYKTIHRLMKRSVELLTSTTAFSFPPMYNKAHASIDFFELQYTVYTVQS